MEKIPGKTPIINTPEEAKACKERRRQYTDNYKRIAVVAFIRIGKVGLASEELGLDRHTLREWTRESWWEEMVQEYKTDRATNPMAATTRERLDNIIDIMLKRYEVDGVIDDLGAREIGFNLKQIIHARSINSADPETQSQIMSNMAPAELDRMIVKLKREISEAENGTFGDSSYKPPEEPTNGEDTDAEQGELAEQPEGGPGEGDGGEAQADPAEQAPPV